MKQLYYDMIIISNHIIICMQRDVWYMDMGRSLYLIDFHVLNFYISCTHRYNTSLCRRSKVPLEIFMSLLSLSTCWLIIRRRRLRLHERQWGIFFFTHNNKKKKKNRKPSPCMQARVIQHNCINPWCKQRNKKEEFLWYIYDLVVGLFFIFYCFSKN